jgi:hypothetical protein
MANEKTGTITRNRQNRGNGASTAPKKDSSVALLAMLAIAEMTVYGVGSPLYLLEQTFGTVSPVNTLDTAFNSFAEAKANLGDNQVGFSYSSEYDRFSLAMKVNGGVAFCGLIHDKDGEPRVETDLVLVQVVADREFKLPDTDDVIINKGDRFIKAAPQKYVDTLKKAA